MKDKKDGREMFPVRDEEIVTRFRQGCTIKDLTRFVAEQEGISKCEAKKRVERTIYEAVRRL